MLFCLQKNSESTPTTNAKTPKPQKRHGRQFEDLGSYFTDEEKNYLAYNFGEFNLNTLHETTSGDKTITTVASGSNDDQKVRVLVITEKVVGDKFQVMKEIFTVSSNTS